MPTEAYRRLACPILSDEDCTMEAPLRHWRLQFMDGDGREFEDTLYAAVQEFDPGAGIVTMGDTKCGNKPATPADFASVWNRAMARLGFTEGNPEA